MRGRPGSVRSLEEFGRVRLSASFFMRDFLHSEIADFHGIPNIPDDPELAIAAGRQLCKQLLEPLQATFGRLSIRSAYRAPAVNEFGNRHGLSCASNLRNYGRHIWDHRDITGAMGAMGNARTHCRVGMGKHMLRQSGVSRSIGNKRPNPARSSGESAANSDRARRDPRLART
jgi:hypothetical protein